MMADQLAYLNERFSGYRKSVTENRCPRIPFLLQFPCQTPNQPFYTNYLTNILEYIAVFAVTERRTRKVAFNHRSHITKICMHSVLRMKNLSLKYPG